MTTKERIYAEIESLGEENLDELYRLIRRFKASRSPSGPGLMTRLKAVQIEGPDDFAENLDLYLSGEKRVEDDLH